MGSIGTSTSTWLLTGANRGIGREFVAQLLARPSTTVIAFNRDPSSESSKSLSSLPVAKDSKLIVIPYDASSSASASAAVKSLQQDHNINAIDVVVANSGILDYHGPSIEASQETFLTHLNINAVGPILLFGATLPLLSNSSTPKYFTISSALGSNALMPEFGAMPLMPYNMSKAAVTYAMSKLSYEYPNVVVNALQPGWVHTDMGNHAADIMGMKEGAPVTLEQSVSGLLKEIDGATRKTSGVVIAYDGARIPY